MNHSSSEKNPAPKNINVPRDARLDTGDNQGAARMPSPDDVNMRDEDYSTENKPLAGDSPAAKALQKNPPRGKDQLGPGTAGDAARPSKEGIHDKPVPPRGHM